MGNSAWVCFACRLAVRRPTWHMADVMCPECRGPCHAIGYRIPVPPKRDLGAWRELQASLADRAAADTVANQRARVRARHALEREIRRLEALPTNASRTRAVKDLRRRLDELP